MDNEEIQGVKFSEFQSATPGNADEVVGLHAGGNARFTVANFILAIRQGIVNLFVPTSRTVNGKALSSDITLDASDVGAYELPSGGIPATDLANGVIPSISTSTPQMDGTGAAGSTGEVSDAGHVHPRDTSKANVAEIVKVLTDPADQNISVGEYVSFNGSTYVCNTAITTGMSASTFTSYLTAVPGGGLNKIQTDFHASASMTGIVDCNSCNSPLAVYQLLIASPNATGFGSIGNQQSSQLKNFLTNPFANYTNVTFQFVSTCLIRCSARNSSDGTVLGKVCYLKGMINNPSNTWTVTDWEEITETIGHKDVEIGTSALGTTFSQTARVIGSASNLFGVAADKILSISIRDAALNPASIMVYGFYSGNFYLAATQSCTLSSSVKFHVTYAV